VSDNYYVLDWLTDLRILLSRAERACDCCGKSAPAMCTNCHAFPLAVSTAESGVPSLCECCDTAIWAASMCNYCGVRPVANHSMCGVHLCDACEVTMWVMRNEHSAHDN